ncbi:hypothetical protein B0A81_18660 [Flavobacterium plurextorum]|uniref:Uncharacterized protein n=1 Tax=Flavobacterium plurextorum TaxID=1114867 RepID=A0ABX4CR76_9FLAO|nr:hypothetical protein [Flavobacterium plurextorum]OXB03365.1 hypothetical protein B0A81_18660 [Flavobacterium plurextorum]
MMLFISLGMHQKIYAQLYGDFPYHQSFTSGVKPSEVLLPAGSGANSAKFTATGLELTPAENFKFGAVIIDNKIFNSSVGIKISFNYAIYGGTGADGISVFLFDAAVNPVISGSAGAGLGYAFRRANNSNSGNRKEGLSGAYLGIALDVFGNFKHMRFNTDERVNGIDMPGILWKDFARSHVTLRGARGNSFDSNGKGEGYTGYPVLTTLGTLEGSRFNSLLSGAVLNSSTGAYDISVTYPGDRFDIRSGVYAPFVRSPGYRKAFIDMTPNPLGGYNVTVKIQHQNIVSTVIDNYWYRTSITYKENANPDASDFNNLNVRGADTKHTIDASIPENFRIGFAASTGSFNDIHKIWNLDISLPFAAKANDDTGETCKSTTFTLSPLTNDIAYAGPTTGTPGGSQENIDKTQFMFINSDGSAAANPYQVTDSQGTFSYSPVTGAVTFFPLSSFSGKASIKYSIKGKSYPNGTFQPYGDEAFRSAPAEITITVLKCKIITNPVLPSKL